MNGRTARAFRLLGLLLVSGAALVVSSVGAQTAVEADVPTLTVPPPAAVVPPAGPRVVPAPGRYPGPITVLPDNGDLEYRFVSPSGVPHTAFFMPLADGVYLDVSDGMEITYRMEVRRRGGHDVATVRFDLDRLPPESPPLDPAPGVYGTAVTLRPPEEGETEIRLPDAPNGGFRPFPSGGVTLSGTAGEVEDYRVAVYRRDAVGNRSAVREASYRIDRRHERPPDETIPASPVAGTFADEQVIVIPTHGLTAITYDLFHNDTLIAEQLVYDGPMIVRGDGRFRLRIGAVPLRPPTGTSRRGVTSGGDRPTWNVAWEQRPGADTTRGNPTPRGASPRVEAADITSAEKVVLPPPDQPTRYTLEDRAVRSDDPLWIEPLELVPTDSHRRVVVVRSRPVGDAGAGAERRRVFVLDGRRAPAALVSFSSAGVAAASVLDAELAWRVVDPDQEDQLRPVYDGVVPWSELPDATRKIEVAARVPGGRWTRRVVDLPEPEPSGAVRAPWAYVSGPRQAHRIVLSARDDPGGIGEAESSTTLFRVETAGPLRWTAPTGFSTSLRVSGRFPAPIRPDREQREVVEVPSGSGEEETVVNVHRAPPPPPTFTRTPSGFRLSGDGALFYRVDGGADVAYRTPVSLRPVEDALRSFVIDVYAVSGGESSPTATHTVVFDRRVPTVPPLLDEDGVEIASAALFREGEVVLRFDTAHSDLLVYVTSAVEGSAPAPTSAALRTPDVMTLHTPPGHVLTHHIAARARFVGGRQWSAVKRYVLTVDRQPPQAPVAEMLPGGILSFAPIDEVDVETWFRTTPTERYSRYSGPVTIDVDRGVTVEAYTRDAAGNTTSMERPVRFDPAPGAPSTPVVLLNGRPVVGPRAAVGREALVEVRGRGSRLWWRVRREDESPTDVPFVEAEEGTAERIVGSGTSPYVVEAYAESADGSRSALRRLSVVVDPAGPRTPPAPFISYHEDGRSGEATWSGTAADRVYVSFTTDRELDSATAARFVPHRGTVPWRIPDGTDRLIVSYFVVDSDAVRSDTAVTTIQARRFTDPPRVVGVEDGGVYRDTRTVSLSASSEIRYSVVSQERDGSRASVAPGHVRAISPLYDEPLSFSASVGEEVFYHLRARVFDGATAVSEPVDVRFVIDRRIPPSPELTGARDGGTYHDEREIRFSDWSDGRLMYRVTTDDQDDEDPAVSYRTYTGEPVLLPVRGGAVTDYRVEAYRVDPAGNRSQGVSSWSITIDGASVFVNPSAASSPPGSRDGSLDAPFADVNEAIGRLHGTDRWIVRLAEGSYDLTARVWRRINTPAGGIVLEGGYRADGTPGGRHSTVVVMPDDPARDVRGDLNGDAGEDPPALTISAEIHVRRLRFNQTVAVDVDNDRTVQLTDVVIAADRGFFVRRGSARMTSSVVTGATGVNDASLSVVDSALEEVESRRGELSIQGGSLTELRLRAGSSADIAAVRIDGTRNGGRILVSADGARLTVSDSTITSDGVEPVLFRLRDTETSMYRVHMSARGNRSAVAIRSNGGTLRLTESFVSARAPRFAHGLLSRATTVVSDGTGWVAMSAEEAVTLVVDDADATLLRSILVADGSIVGAVRAATGAGTRRLTAVDTILAVNGRGAADDSTAIRTQGATDLEGSGLIIAGAETAWERRVTPNRWTSRRERYAVDGIGPDSLAVPFPPGLTWSFVVGDGDPAPMERDEVPPPLRRLRNSF